MSVTINQKQLEKIIELAYIGYYLLIDSAEDENELHDYTEAFQSFYSGIKSNLKREVVVEDENHDVFFNGDGKERKYVKDLIQRYDDRKFIDQLPYYLAKKDATLEYSSKTNYGLIDYYERIKILEDAYFNEFEENGLERLGIIEKIELGDEDSIVLDHQIYI